MPRPISLFLALIKCARASCRTSDRI